MITQCCHFANKTKWQTDGRIIYVPFGIGLKDGRKIYLITKVKKFCFHKYHGCLFFDVA